MTSSILINKNLNFLTLSKVILACRKYLTISNYKDHQP